jgi:uncharacterized membrane protein
MDQSQARERLNVRPGAIATAALAAAMLAASVWAWDKVPESLPVHFGLDGTADRYGSKWEALLAMPSAVAVIGLIMAAIPAIDPRRNNLAQSSGFYYAVWLGALAVLGVAHACLIATAMGADVNAGQIVGIAVGGLFVLLGNFMGKSRSNWFAGFRTPWTLSSDYSWQRTHRVTGWMLILTGVATIMSAIFLGPIAAFAAMSAGTVGTVILGSYLSYVFWKNDPERGQG